MSRPTSGPELRRIPPDDPTPVIDVLCEAFRDYPVMRYVLGDGPDREARLRRLIAFFVQARVVRGEPLLGLMEDGDLIAAATISFPGVPASPSALRELADLRSVWRELGADALARYERCGEAWKPLLMDSPRIHVNMIGVRSDHRGRGLARRLLDEVHGMSRTDTGSEGVSLTTEDPENVGFYEHMGYRVFGHARIAPELESWGMFRAD